MSERNGNGIGPVSDGDDRDGRGRFSAGNKASRGNPHAKRVNRIRSALMKAADPKRIGAAVAKLLEQAEGGDRLALAEILDRTIGRPIPADIEERIAALEQALREQHRL